jgi:hypothetical protein
LETPTLSLGVRDKVLHVVEEVEEAINTDVNDAECEKGENLSRSFTSNL